MTQTFCAHVQMISNHCFPSPLLVGLNNVVQPCMTNLKHVPVLRFDITRQWPKNGKKTKLRWSPPPITNAKWQKLLAAWQVWRPSMVPAVEPRLRRHGRWTNAPGRMSIEGLVNLVDKCGQTPNSKGQNHRYGVAKAWSLIAYHDSSWKQTILV